ncbi:hypothetical protein GZH47_26280 [Paenibacillus rhizovicinus]|uniref:Bacterial Ig domain-containing protein n=1 Tax=Paenibacillus rhizovicinus TaxID=2704463 RepID=A0A6C0P616_9BACL|nr:Ig-like domain-containing protein [Paenibacillus rhizovicinus]QHW33958.1 hypothetical protein GZH47_26280 [Paenibacillus rhizovicinus]
MKRTRLLVMLTIAMACMISFSVLPVKANTTAQGITLPALQQASAGARHILAVGEDGSLWAWGDNSEGELGDGTFRSSGIPVRVGSDKDWASTAAGDRFSIAVKRDGSLWMWGTNRNREAITKQKTPLRFGNGNDWFKVTAGDAGAAALTKHGYLLLFGVNLQTGTIYVGSELNGDRDWADVSIGAECLLALKQNGTLWAQGVCTPTGSKGIPLTQVGDSTDWAAIGAGSFGVALNHDGQAFDLKSGSSPNSIKLVNVKAAFAKAVRVSSGFVPVLVSEDGSLWKWDTVFDKYDRIPSDTPMKEAAIGNGFGVAIARDGTTWTWGQNEWGQLGDGESDSAYVPVAAGTTVKAISKSDSYNFILHQDGTLWHQDGIDHTMLKQISTDTDWVSISTGRSEVYALKPDGSLWVYQTGSYFNSARLSGVSDNIMQPLLKGRYWTDIQVSEQGYAVALNKDGSLWVWGTDAWGKIMPSDFEHLTEPHPLSPAKDWQSFSINGSHLLAIKKDGTLWGMGDNRQGQLGLPSYNANTDKMMKVGSDRDWAQVRTGASGSIALRKDGSLWQWGKGWWSQTEMTGIVQVGSDKDWSRIWSSTDTAFVLKKNGSLWSWGRNDYGQVGSGSAGTIMEPSSVADKGPWTEVIPGTYYTVGTKKDGSVWIWGDDKESVFGYMNSTSELKMSKVSAIGAIRVPDPTWKAAFMPFRLNEKEGKVQTSPSIFVSIYKNGKLIASGQSNSAGIFRFAFPHLADGKYSAQVRDAGGNLLASASYIYGDVNPPASPKPSTPAAKATVVQGNAEPYSRVTLMYANTSYSAKTDGKGSFKIIVPPLAAGSKLTIWATDAAGNQGVSVTVAISK